MVLASLNNFSFSYSQSRINALANINLDIKKGEFLIICGPSGCGKTSLLLNLKEEIAPVGVKSGILNMTIPSGEISVVFQNTESQLITSSVINDLTFHMENLGFDNVTMKKRMAETVGFFGIEGLLHKNPQQLSGGQKQLIALCGAMMTQPQLLLLDEPISQLDPIAAKEFLETLQRINDELGVTVVMTEHRLDDVCAIAHRVIIMNEGEICYDGTPLEVVTGIWKNKDTDNAYFIPSLAKTALTISNGKNAVFKPREFTDTFECGRIADIRLKASGNINKDTVALAKSITFKYPKSMEYVLKNLDMSIYKDEFVCIVGGNGSGKSTLLKAMAGIVKPYMGSVKKVYANIGYMPQNVNAFFTADTVGEQLINANKADEKTFSLLVGELKLGSLLNHHPYDISGGEQQRAALAAILLSKPDIIILDEPTKGLDPYFKTVAAGLLKTSGAAVLAATHDLEFAANFADRCMMLFDGDIAFCAEPKEFFKKNRFYTTEIGKTMRSIGIDAVTYEDVIKLWEKEKPDFIAG